jgi:hypothetical protein
MMRLISTPPAKPATHADFAAFEFKGITSIGKSLRNIA